MPVWLTVAIGLPGRGGGGACHGDLGPEREAAGPLAFLGAVLLVVAYRRFVQKRPLTGPDALKFPDKGFGIDRFTERRQKMEDLMRQAQHAQAANARRVEPQKLSDLHKAGILTDEEFEAKRKSSAEPGELRFPLGRGEASEMH